jgi:hypothetical protein
MMRLLCIPLTLLFSLSGSAMGEYSNFSRWSNAAKTGGKVFWSGGTPARKAAEAFAQQTGVKTLEMTKTGRFLDTITTDKTYPFLSVNFQIHIVRDFQIHIG